MIVDAHTHYGLSDDGNAVSLEKLELHRKRNKIDYVCLFPFSGGAMIEDSLHILSLSRKYNWVIPFLRFDPVTITRVELVTLLKKDFRGVKLHPRAQNFDPLDKKLAWVFELLAKSGLPVLFHCKSYHFDPMSHPERLLALAKRYPALTVVLGHFAGVNKSLFKEFLQSSNVWVESSVDVTPNAYREVLQKIGFTRVLFGTDFPYSLGEVELAKIRLAGLPSHLVDLVLWKNAAMLFDL